MQFIVSFISNLQSEDNILPTEEENVGYVNEDNDNDEEEDKGEEVTIAKRRRT